MTVRNGDFQLATRAQRSGPPVAPMYAQQSSPGAPWRRWSLRQYDKARVRCGSAHASRRCCGLPDIFLAEEALGPSAMRVGLCLCVRVRPQSMVAMGRAGCVLDRCLQQCSGYSSRAADRERGGAAGRRAAGSGSGGGGGHGHDSDNADTGQSLGAAARGPRAAGLPMRAARGDFLLEPSRTGRVPEPGILSVQTGVVTSR